MTERGTFLIVEGTGGAGKGTQMSAIEEYFNHLGEPVHITREPGGIESAEKIRSLIFSLRDKGLINADQQIAMFFTARHFWMQGVVIPKLEGGTHVVADRSYPSTAAYQGYAEGGDVGIVEALTEEILGNYKPNAIIFIDVSREEAERRKVDKGGDPFDAQGSKYQDKVIAGYRLMAQEHWNGVPWYIVNGEQSIEEVTQEIYQVLDQILCSRPS